MRRRALLVSGLGAAGALVVGWGALPPRDRLGAVDALPVDAGEVSLNGWIKIGADGTEAIARRQHAPADDQRAGRAEAADEQGATPHAMSAAALRRAARRRG